ncbi:hypothetical protein [Paraburkholderia flagellata]|uniref:hypothetical protein n=1 Tax=Paraburkholderia flagellata TaxID=2883241 RepID=UPI001F27CD2C|nr:hypothetical protein [Paraburkholderia flagellata]
MSRIGKLSQKRKAMKLRTADLYYGAVLSRIAGFPVLTEIHQVGQDGFYEINGERRLLVKYSIASGPVWRFAFSPDDIARLAKGARYDTWITLVCATESICLLSLDQLGEVIDLGAVARQWVSVSIAPGHSLKVAGSLGLAQYTVRRNAFPADMLVAGRRTEDFRWPPLCQIRVYRSGQGLAYTTEDPFFDFADHLALDLGRRPKVVHVGMLTRSPEWTEWTPVNLKRVEEKISHDLAFDGYDVRIERITPETKGKNCLVPLCSREFLWKLTISVAR